MKILIVNDDSITAPGIEKLANAASCLGEVWVVAPEAQCSALSQKLTLREQLTVRKIEDFPVKAAGAYAVGGTPVDCVKVALTYILKEKPDYVFSGINNGYNAGFDIAYSGTLGAAFEGARSGIPSLAFSTAGDAHLDAVEPYLLPVIRELLEEKIEPGMVWNVNFPALKNRPLAGILRDRPVAPVSMYQETYIESIQPDGTVRLNCQGIPTPDSTVPAGTDVEAVRRGYISIGKVRAF